MKNLKLFAVSSILSVVIFYWNDISLFLSNLYNVIFDFLTYSVFWKIKIWMVAVWGVYKCSYYIWQTDDSDPHYMEDTGREYKSLQEARYKEFKHQTQVENLDREVIVENWTDKDGSWYFIIRVIHDVGEFMFIPFKKN